MNRIDAAEQISHSCRGVPKPLPLAGALSSKQRQRFRHEARAVATLQHPPFGPASTVAGLPLIARQRDAARTAADVALWASSEDDRQRRSEIWFWDVPGMR